MPLLTGVAAFSVRRFLFAQRSGQTRPVARYRRHPDQQGLVTVFNATLQCWSHRKPSLESGSTFCHSPAIALKANPPQSPFKKWEVFNSPLQLCRVRRAHIACAAFKLGIANNRAHGAPYKKGKRLWEHLLEFLSFSSYCFKGKSPSIHLQKVGGF